VQADLYIRNVMTRKSDLETTSDTLSLTKIELIKCEEKGR